MIRHHILCVLLVMGLVFVHGENPRAIAINAIGEESVSASFQSCICSVDDSQTRGTIGCGSQGFGRKWCYVDGANCSAVAKKSSGPKWKYCDGYLCQPFFQLPGLQFLEFRIYAVSEIDSIPVLDWPECCKSCSLTRNCAAWRFSLLSDQAVACNLFIGATEDPILAQKIVEHLRETAVPFAFKVTPFNNQVYGVPGYDDVVRVCPGLRWASGFDEFREGGQCLSLLYLLHLLNIFCLAAFVLCCLPGALRWVRFAQVVSERGVIVPCTATPERIRHEWQWTSQKAAPGGGSYQHCPVHEVKLQWERPVGKIFEMHYSDLDQLNDVFDGLLPSQEAFKSFIKLPLPIPVETPRTLFEKGMANVRYTQQKPTAGVWAIQKVTAKTSIEIAALIDLDYPDVAAPFLAHESLTAAEILKIVYAAPTCACGLFVFLPLLLLAMLKWRFPLLADRWLPLPLQGYDSVRTISRYMPAVGLWDLPTLIIVAQIGFVAILILCLCCSFPWWFCYARKLLIEVAETPYGFDEETERLL